MTALGGHAIGLYHSLQLGVVVDTEDPESRGRIKVQLHSANMQLWAPVMVAAAGGDYGVAMLPRVDEQVVLAFISEDQAIVMGSLWHGGASLPSESDAPDQHYQIKTPSGNYLLMDDEEGPSVTLQTPGGNKVNITDEGGGKVTVQTGSQEVVMDSSSINITASAKVKIEAAQVEVSAAMVKVEAGISQFSGVVQCDTLITNSVISSSYTPGAGNIW